MEGVNTLSYELSERGLLVMDGSGWSNWGFVKVLIYMCLMSVICICNRYYKRCGKRCKIYLLSLPAEFSCKNNYKNFRLTNYDVYLEAVHCGGQHYRHNNPSPPLYYLPDCQDWFTSHHVNNKDLVWRREMPDDKNHYAVRKSDMTCDCVTEPWNTQ